MEGKEGMTIVKTHEKGVYYSCDPGQITGIRITGLECNFPVWLGSRRDDFAFNMLVPHLFADCVQAKVESKQIVIQAVRPLIARRDAMDMLPEITVNFPETTKIGTLILERYQRRSSITVVSAIWSWISMADLMRANLYFHPLTVWPEEGR